MAIAWLLWLSHRVHRASKPLRRAGTRFGGLYGAIFGRRTRFQRLEQSLACDGLLMPLILRTYCNAAAWTSSFVTGGSKLKSGLILRHMSSSSFSLSISALK